MRAVTRAEPLELPAFGAFLAHGGGKASWVGFDPVVVSLFKGCVPSAGYVLLHKDDSGAWHSWRLRGKGYEGARSTALSVVRASDAPVVLGRVTSTTRGGQVALVDAVARYEPVTEASLAHMALDAADRAMVLLQKAPPKDPFDRRTFDRMVDGMGDDLGDRAESKIKGAVQRAVRQSEVDWATATEADHKRFAVALAAALGVAAAAVWKAVKAPR